MSCTELFDHLNGATESAITCIKLLVHAFGQPINFSAIRNCLQSCHHATSAARTALRDHSRVGEQIKQLCNLNLASWLAAAAASLGCASAAGLGYDERMQLFQLSLLAAVDTLQLSQRMAACGHHKLREQFDERAVLTAFLDAAVALCGRDARCCSLPPQRGSTATDDASRHVNHLKMQQDGLHLMLLLLVASLDSEPGRDRYGGRHTLAAVRACNAVPTISRLLAPLLATGMMHNQGKEAVHANMYLVMLTRIAGNGRTAADMALLDDPAVGDAFSAVCRVLTAQQRPDGAAAGVQWIQPANVLALLLHYCPSARAQLATDTLLLQLADAVQALCCEPDWPKICAVAVDHAMQLLYALLLHLLARRQVNSSMLDAAAVAAVDDIKQLQPRLSSSGSSSPSAAAGGQRHVEDASLQVRWHDTVGSAVALLTCAADASVETLQDLLRRDMATWESLVRCDTRAEAIRLKELFSKVAVPTATVEPPAGGEGGGGAGSGAMGGAAPAGSTAAAAATPPRMRAEVAIAARRLAMRIMCMSDPAQPGASMFMNAVVLLIALHKGGFYLRPTDFATTCKRVDALSGLGRMHATMLDTICRLLPLLSEEPLLPRDVPLVSVCSMHLLRAASTLYRLADPKCTTIEMCPFTSKLIRAVGTLCMAGVLRPVADSGICQMLYGITETYLFAGGRSDRSNKQFAQALLSIPFSIGYWTMLPQQLRSSSEAGQSGSHLPPGTKQVDSSPPAAAAASATVNAGAAKPAGTAAPRSQGGPAGSAVHTEPLRAGAGADAALEAAAASSLITTGLVCAQGCVPPQNIGTSVASCQGPLAELVLRFARSCMVKVRQALVAREVCCAALALPDEQLQAAAEQHPASLDVRVRPYARHILEAGEFGQLAQLTPLAAQQQQQQQQQQQGQGAPPQGARTPLHDLLNGAVMSCVQRELHRRRSKVTEQCAAEEGHSPEPLISAAALQKLLEPVCLLQLPSLTEADDVSLGKQLVRMVEDRNKAARARRISAGGPPTQSITISSDVNAFTSGQPSAREESPDVCEWYEAAVVQLGLKFGCCNLQCGNVTPDMKQHACAACKRAWYCSVACQKAAWRGHKPHCIAARAQQ